MPSSHRLATAAWICGAALASVVCAVPSAASAQATRWGFSRPAPAPRLDEPRIRFGVELWGFINGRGGYGFVGSGVRLGVQASDLVGVYVQAQGAGGFSTSGGAVSAMVDFTLRDVFTVGAGVGWGSSAGSGTGLQMAGLPVRVAVNFGPDDPTRSVRHRFSLGLDGMIGVPLEANGSGDILGLMGGVGLGYESM